MPSITTAQVPVTITNMATSPETPRPRSRILSFGSRRSRSSGSNSLTKADLVESPKEKANRKMTTKADPNIAMKEAQPGKKTHESFDTGLLILMSHIAAQALEQTTITSLRSMQHRDAAGNLISKQVAWDQEQQMLICIQPIPISRTRLARVSNGHWTQSVASKRLSMAATTVALRRWVRLLVMTAMC